MFKPVQFIPRQFEIQVYTLSNGVVIVVNTFQCSIYEFDRIMSYVVKHYPFENYLIHVQEHIHWEKE